MFFGRGLSSIVCIFGTSGKRGNTHNQIGRNDTVGRRPVRWPRNGRGAGGAAEAARALVNGRSGGYKRRIAAAAQRRAIVRAIERGLAEEGRRPLGVEGLGAGWTLLDFGDCLVHLFSPELRAYYDLDLLWGDCPRMDWEAT